ncbi:MAG: protein-glutamine glutaminase family protein [Chitinophagales bacterium]
MRTKQLLFPFFAVVLFLSSCSKEISTVQNTLLPQDEYQLMRLAYYRDIPDGTDGIGLRFLETPVIINLYSTHPYYEQIKTFVDAAAQEKVPLRVTIKNQDELEVINPASEEEITSIKNFDLQARKITEEPPQIKKVLPNMDVFNEIFDFMEAQGCDESTVTIDQCISFQYVVDGCYARAHKMRQVLIENYSYSCEKVFSYEGPSGYLAVDAGECCVYWWYHVAPLVSVNEDGVINKYVMDPSMFEEPVSIETWTGAQENMSCSPYADFGYYDIQRGQFYSPGWWSSYSTDEDLWSTNYTLDAYSDLETCD